MLSLVVHHTQHIAMEASRLYRASLRAASNIGRPRYTPRSICARCLSTCTVNNATPVSRPAVVVGPPPSAPEQSPTHPKSRLARKREQLELVKKEGRNSRPFWKNVSVSESKDGRLQIMLDSRPVRTATKQVLTLPQSKRALAAAIALEWDQLVSAQQALKQHYIPLTSLT